jgi:2-keto-3-deoxy-L-rhamnonate aldolase RhmA/quercetin dioxygenase-like cupin family protein
MNTPALKRLREKLSADEPVYGLWITLESASVSEMAVALGLDWIVIDAEHGHLDWREVLDHLRATVRSETVVLVRIAELNAGAIKRVLDIGADGVVIPWIETAEQLKQAVAFAHYPPEGLRGIGAERATGWGECLVQHTREANEHVMVVPVIETVTARRSIEDLARVGGVEIYFLGPADYSSSAGYRGQWEGPEVAAELLAIKDAVRARGKQCGVMATSHENLIERRLQGFRMLALGSDTGLLLRSLHAALGIAGRNRNIVPSFVPESTPLPATPLPRPPASLRPDRPERMNEAGRNAPIDIAPGISLDCLVGAHNGARNLTTGLVTFAPGAQLPCHTHPASESLTLLSGAVVVAVEDREYSLSPLENIVIPRGLPHATRNPSSSEPAVLHVAFASETLKSDLVPLAPHRRAMPADCGGTPGKERVTRIDSAVRSEAGPGTTFIDHFNKDLMPGIEMSGGYGMFQPGGRLPAHFHDFDESICIIGGTSVCVVEGRRYQLGNGSTALVPRGRVHCFINESAAPVAMIWVCSGPVPERFIVDELCATAEGNPWKE